MNCFELVKRYHDLNLDFEDKGVLQNTKQVLEAIKKVEDRYDEVSYPKENDIIVMNDNHVGIFQNGKCHHYTPEYGEAYESMEKIKTAFRKIRYFRKKDDY
jgi:hypothetical protein